MNAAQSCPPIHVSARDRRAPLVLHAIAALMIAGAFSAIPVRGEAADERWSVASHIPAAAADPVRAVTVIDREDIALSGMRTVSDLLISRLRHNSFGLYRPLFLGGRVAYLINGRRISETTVDLDTISISAVERVEVLSGAATLHGGHAIAGAVNIVLRRGYEGAEVSAGAGRPTDAGADSEQGSALYGGALGTGHMTIAADVVRREEIPDAAREHSRAKWTPGGAFADASGVSVGGNTLRIVTENDTIERPLGECSENIYTGVLIHHRGTGCGYAYADISWGIPRYERDSLFLALDHPLGDGADMYLDARLARDETLERFAPSVGTFEVQSAALQGHLPPTSEIGPLPETVRVSHRFIGHGNREWRTTLEEYDLTLGLEGRFAGGIGYDAHLRFYRHDSVVDGTTFVSESAIRQAIGDGRYDLVNPLSPSNREAIGETALRLTRDRVTDHKTARATLDGPMFALGGGEARWAAGAEFAAEDWKDVHAYRDRSGISYDALDVLGAGGIYAAGERRRLSGFAEVSLPVRDDWDVTLAGRGDDHDDVGATYSHQLASQIRLHDDLTLRGAWDSGSKAPSLRNLHLRDSIDYPWVCDTKTHNGPAATCPVEQEERVSRGNIGLEPDEAGEFQPRRHDQPGASVPECGLVPDRAFRGACPVVRAVHRRPRGQGCAATRCGGDPRRRSHQSDREPGHQQRGDRCLGCRCAGSARLGRRVGGSGPRRPLAAHDPLREPGGRRAPAGRLSARPRPCLAQREPGRSDRELECAFDLELLERAPDRPLRRLGGPRRDGTLARCLRPGGHGPYRWRP